MSRKEKKPESKPSKAYLVSFGDTMTALLAFFIVLNSLAKDQTGAKMHAGTGSFMNAIKSLGVPGDFSGSRTRNTIAKTAPTPIYAVPSEDKQTGANNKGPDAVNDEMRILSRESDEFQRFLNEMQRQFEVHEGAPVHRQIVLDTWAKLGDNAMDLLDSKAIDVASEAISQLANPDVEVELIIWANMPSPKALEHAIERAEMAKQQIGQLFSLSAEQRNRLCFSAKPWLFVDAKRPTVSFVISRMANPATAR